MTMTLHDFLDWMDGNGLIVADIEMIEDELNKSNYSLESEIQIEKISTKIYLVD